MGNLNLYDRCPISSIQPYWIKVEKTAKNIQKTKEVHGSFSNRYQAKSLSTMAEKRQFMKFFTKNNVNVFSTLIQSG